MKKLEELGISKVPWSTYVTKKEVAIVTSAGFDDLESSLCRGKNRVANARLTSAAPDLYDALQQIIQCWGASVFDEGGMACDTPLYCKHAGCRPETCPVFLRAKSALAKAAGEETK